MASDPNKKPIGQRIRDVINPALADKRKQEIQLEILNEYFKNLAEALPSLVEKACKDFFNDVAKYKSFSDEASTNYYIIHALTAAEKGQPGFSPILRFGVSVVTTFTQFSSLEIKELPSYIELHKVARDLDVALKLVGVIAEEKGQTPHVVIDGSKTYAEGAMENSMLYPNLPPVPKKAPRFDRDGGDFDL